MRKPAKRGVLVKGIGVGDGGVDQACLTSGEIKRSMVVGHIRFCCSDKLWGERMPLNPPPPLEFSRHFLLYIEEYDH